jgi:transglutaminase-like putative cysteine protease
MRAAALAVAVAASSLAAGCASAPKGAAYHGETAVFKARNAFTVTPPKGAKSVKGWFAMPQTDGDQEIRGEITITAPGAYQVVPDDQGNWYVHVEATAAGGADIAPFEVVEEFTLARREVRTRLDPAKTRPLTEAETREMALHLAANREVPLTEPFRKVAAEATKGETNPLKAARLLYDWTLKNIDYWVKHPDRLKASPVGSATYCMETKTGNCTDFHSLWTSLARTRGIPTRIVYGSFFKKELSGQDRDQSYHCWIEFWAPGLGWIPHDVAVADLFVGDFAVNKDNDEKVRLTTADGYGGKDPAKVEYYFGNIDARRVVWSRGRDLRLEGASGPVNALPKAHVEVDGKPLAEKEGWTRKLTFTDVAR